MSSSRYPANVFWSDDDDAFIAVAPDLPGCSAFGDSQNEAIAQLQYAIEAWIEASSAAGNPIPIPSKPAQPGQFSGKVLLRMPRSLHADLARAAADDNVSLNQYVVYLLTKNHASTNAAINIVPGTVTTSSSNVAFSASTTLVGMSNSLVNIMPRNYSWADLGPIKNYEFTTEENVDNFQQFLGPFPTSNVKRA